MRPGRSADASGILRRQLFKAARAWCNREIIRLVPLITKLEPTWHIGPGWQTCRENGGRTPLPGRRLGRVECLVRRSMREAGQGIKDAE